MAEKKPLVVGPDGRPRQLQSGDFLHPGVRRVIADGETLTLADTECLVLARYLTIEGSGSLILEGDAEVAII